MERARLGCRWNAPVSGADGTHPSRVQMSAPVPGARVAVRHCDVLSNFVILRSVASRAKEKGALV